jgi:hypothetical protein
MIKRYIESYDIKQPASVFFRVFGESWLLEGFLAYLSIWICNMIGVDGSESLLDMTQDEEERFSKYEFVLSVVFAPIVETVLFQIIPFELCKKFFKNLNLGFLCSFLIFMALHFTNSIHSGIIAGVGGGFYLGLIYFLFREEQFSKAVFMTVLIHTAMNFTVSAMEGV